MSQRTYGAGIIGAGVIFKDHARAFTQLAPRARLVGLADIDLDRARRAAAEFFVPVVTADYHELLARDDVDIISICTPPSLHEQLVLDALAAGKYVLCEKPLAHTLAAADRIIEAAQEHPGRLSVVHQKRFTPAVRRAEWLCQEGQLGPLQFGTFNRCSSIPAQHRTGESWWGKWDVAGGGALMTQCIHELDVQLLLFGPAKRVTATMATLGSDIESEDTISATVEHANGALVSVACSLGHHVGFRDSWMVMGRDVAVHHPWAVNTEDRRNRNHLLKAATTKFPNSRPKSRLPGPVDKVVRFAKLKLGIGRRELFTEHKPYIQAVLRAMEEGTELPVTASDARPALELCTAIYAAAITGETVELPLAKDTPFYEGVTTKEYAGAPASSLLHGASA